MMMHIDRVYTYPIWAVGLLLIGLAAGGAVIVELIARRIIPLETRQAHNDVAAAMFTVIGTTFAVLLAFVAMLAWEDFGNARAAAVNEAAIAHDVADASNGLLAPARGPLRAEIIAYLHAVIDREWPAQAAGAPENSGTTSLRNLNGIAAAYRPTGPADTNFHAALLAALARLQDARATRQLSASGNLPAMVWVVMLLGGSLTVFASSFLGAPRLHLHLIMSVTLAVSGALVVLLILVLSQPFRGDFRVSTAPYERQLSEISAVDDIAR